MIDAFSVDPTKDLPTERKLNVAAVDFVVKQKPEDPYGYWWISREKGQVPVELSGAYTNPQLAEQAVQSYMNKKK